jgi:hypothetical protein
MPKAPFITVKAMLNMYNDLFLRIDPVFLFGFKLTNRVSSNGGGMVAGNAVLKHQRGRGGN